MRNAIACAGILALAAGVATADSARPTFTKDVVPILQENCQICHRPVGKNNGGMVAPMALTTYQEVRPWAKAISRQVSEKSMPPWHASSEFNGVFANERTLTQEQIDTIVTWVEQGCRPGNPSDTPAEIVWPETRWSIGEPDIVVGMPDPYFVEDEVEDLYVDIPVMVTQEQLPEARWIQATEIKAGSEVVHHVIAFPLAGNAPGYSARTYPEGYGAMLKPEQKVNFQMHYHKESGPGTGTYDQTEIGVKFHTQPVHHAVQSSAIGNRWFEIPPGQADWMVGASRTFEEDTLILNMMPHMHLRGKSAKYTAYYEDGTTEVMLEVPEYDFNWQTPYEYPEPKLIPAGTRIDVEMHFDNSEGNPYNPDPTQAVVFDGPTTAEMMLGWMSITSAEARPDPLLDEASTD